MVAGSSLPGKYLQVLAEGFAVLLSLDYRSTNCHFLRTSGVSSGVARQICVFADSSFVQMATHAKTPLHSSA